MPAAELMVPKRLKIKFGNRRIKEINIVNSECDKSVTTNSVSKVRPSSDGNKKSVVQSSGSKKLSSVDISNDQFFVQGVNKRRSQELTEDQLKKRQKMDRSSTQQCSHLLQILMRHRFGWIFNQPVDPVKLKIPDYFSVISKPMDLGTIKSNLDNNIYLGLEAFAADVRLTFSNAMIYNPPSTDVHQMAKELLELFELRWKSVEEKGIGRNSGLRKIDETRESNPKTPQLCRSSVLKRPKRGEKAVRNSEASTVVSQVEGLPKAAQNPATKLFGQSLLKGSDITLDKSHEDQPCGVEASEQARSFPATQRSMSDSHSDGTVTSVDDANVCSVSQPTVPLADAASGEGLTIQMFDVQMSPKKSLRAVLLKSRFADTILKAKQKTLLGHEEKEKLEKRHQEEKARIEAEIRAASAASQIELRRQRERDRETARIALQKMGKTVEFEDNLKVLKELESLSKCSLYYPMRGRKNGSSKHPLEQLGLFLKDD
ncbi:transcription factor GTE12 isoform X2 [Carica papaya]|uniref:transcription factor GTE12 isoform X2 n=1 Tax=Carica papaya TaxID=3649 RepID=UPI000B8CE3C8|nr:transcription factor GTE12 isoform X2 [Carica papaya]